MLHKFQVAGAAGCHHGILVGLETPVGSLAQTLVHHKGGVYLVDIFEVVAVCEAAYDGGPVHFVLICQGVAVVHQRLQVFGHDLVAEPLVVASFKRVVFAGHHHSLLVKRNNVLLEGGVARFVDVLLLV